MQIYLKPGVGAPPPIAPDKDKMTDAEFKTATGQHKKALETFKALKPCRVRMPERNYDLLPAAGATVQKTPYWHRRLLAFEVVECEAPKAAAPSTAATETS